jgi:hypothetical protein
MPIVVVVLNCLLFTPTQNFRVQVMRIGNTLLFHNQRCEKVVYHPVDKLSCHLCSIIIKWVQLSQVNTRWFNRSLGANVCVSIQINFSMSLYVSLPAGKQDQYPQNQGQAYCYRHRLPDG